MKLVRLPTLCRRWASLLLAVAALACTDSHLLTGQFQARTTKDPNSDAAPITVAGIDGKPLFDQKYLQVSLGQYGWKVAGAVDFYDDIKFTQCTPPAAGPYPYQYLCQFIDSGSFSGNQLTFSFVAPPPNDSVHVSASLSADGSGNVLTGTLFVVNKDGGAATQVAVTFVRDQTALQVDADEEDCANIAKKCSTAEGTQ